MLIHPSSSSYHQSSYLNCFRSDQIFPKIRNLAQKYVDCHVNFPCKTAKLGLQVTFITLNIYDLCEK